MPGHVYEWLRSHDSLAAWFQGVGTILALAVAFIVAGMQSRAARAEAEKERSIRGRALAFLIIGDLKLMRNSLADPGTAYVTVRLLGPALTHRLDQLYLLGDAGMAILECVVLANEDAMSFEPAQPPYDQRPSRKKAFVACEVAVKLVERIIAGKDPFHSGSPPDR